jgi:hypothetical protein
LNAKNKAIKTLKAGLKLSKPIDGKITVEISSMKINSKAVFKKPTIISLIEYLLI